MTPELKAKLEALTNYWDKPAAEVRDLLLPEIERLEDLLAANEWTPVADDHELPPPHKHFLALNRDGRIFESCMCYGMHEPWFTYPYGDGNASNTAPPWIDVTHWMPKPELRHD